LSIDLIDLMNCCKLVSVIIKFDQEIFIKKNGNVMNMKKEMPPCMILCGGMGTRLRDVTELLPKPMVPIGEQPIIWHIMKLYAAYGVKRFILCLGYKRETFIDYFLNYHERSTDVTIKLGENKNITYHSSHGEEDWEVTLAFTGIDCMTGGRVFRGSKYLKEGDEEFFLTYGDAVANVDIASLYKFHEEKQKEITLTTIHPSGRFGVVKLNGANVDGFHEKPETEKDLINGGFMVLKKSFVSKYLTDDNKLIFERIPMNDAVKDNQMAGFVHEGFWQCMDIQREYEYLNKLWNKNMAPWKVW
jgi:glucose-1-phosphate cytidylyltransferase